MNPTNYYHYNIETGQIKHLNLRHPIRNKPNYIIIAIATDNSRDAYKSEDDLSQVFIDLSFLKREEFSIETHFYQVENFKRNIHIMFILSKEYSLFYHLNNATLSFQDIIDKCRELFDLYFHKNTASVRRITICSYLLNCKEK